MRTSSAVCAGLVLALAMTTSASTAPAGSASGGRQPHPWHALVETLPDVQGAPLVLTDEVAVRSAIGSEVDVQAREAVLGAPLPEHPFAEVAGLRPGFDFESALGFGLGDVQASVTVEGQGTAYRLGATLTAAQLAERGWTVSVTRGRILADPVAVDVPADHPPVARALSQAMAVLPRTALVGEELTAALPSGARARGRSSMPSEPLRRVLDRVAAQRAEAAVVVFDGYRPQRPFAPEWLETFRVGAVAAAGAPQARRLVVVLWHDRVGPAQTNRQRLSHWLQWFADHSSNLDEPVTVRRDGRLVHGSVATSDPQVLMTLHRHRALPIGTESPRRD